MKMDTKNFNNPEFAEACTMLYFKVLFEMALGFTCTGEDVLNIPQHSDRPWATKFFEILIRHEVFGPNVSFQEVSSLLDREYIALFCLADDILMSMSYEFILREKLKEISHQKRTYENKGLIKRLNTISQKLRRIRCKEFQRLAYNNGMPDFVKEAVYFVFQESESSVMQIEDQSERDVILDLRAALHFAPIVYQYFPRSHGSRPAILSRLVKHYRLEIDNCIADLYTNLQQGA